MIRDTLDLITPMEFSGHSLGIKSNVCISFLQTFFLNKKIIQVIRFITEKVKT